MSMSPEMGVIKSKEELPFPQEKVGTYSCHGVEPGNRAGETAAKINQDRGCVVYPFGQAGKNYQQAFFCVYDGHGALGDKVSHYAMNKIQEQLETHESLDTNPEKALKETFVAVDEALKKDKSIDAELSGTTAVVILYRQEGNKVTFWSACCGDSRAVLATRSGTSWTAQDITEDQKPDTPAEMKRIKEKGGFVSPPEEEWGGPARVWIDANMTLPGLAMARSIGDHLVSNIGVFAEPEVTCQTLDASTFNAADSTVFLVMASDGVWEFIDSQPAVNLCGKHIRESKDATLAVTKLIETAAAKWRQEEGDYRDDITAIVARLDNLFPEGGPSQ